MYERVGRWFWAGLALGLVLVVVVAVVASCMDVDTETISGATVFGFAGQKSTVEVATEDATVTYKVQYQIGGSWSDIWPSDSSPDDVLTVFSGMSDRWTWSYGGTAPDSTRVIVTPDSATDVTVRVN